jgi:hypothetical protein
MMRMGVRFRIALLFSFYKIHITRSYFNFNFGYIQEQKQWKVIFADGQWLLLKRNTSAKDILCYSSSFAQINQQHIINIDIFQP